MRNLSRGIRFTILIFALPFACLLSVCIGLAIWVEDLLEKDEFKDWKAEEKTDETRT